MTAARRAGTLIPEDATGHALPASIRHCTASMVVTWHVVIAQPEGELDRSFRNSTQFEPRASDNVGVPDVQRGIPPQLNDNSNANAGD